MLRIPSRRIGSFRSFSSYKAAPTIFSQLGLKHGGTNPGVYSTTGWSGSGQVVSSHNPATGEVLGQIATASKEDRVRVLTEAKDAYKYWRTVPAPRRGNILSQIKRGLEDKKDALGALVSLEMGKIYSEGKGEIQEFIDICDYAVGLSRSMDGRYLPSERPGHVIFEIPNPIGLCGVITAFNFPAAVYGWNLALSLVVGNATLWAPALSAPLTALGIQKVIAEVLEKEKVPGAVSALLTGGKSVGEWITEEKEIPLVSFTGSEKTGLEVGGKVAKRAGKSILELGGNNAAIVLPDADLTQAVPTILFSALGTTSQRCTTTRRLLLHKSISQDFLTSFLNGYRSMIPSRIGDPLSPEVLIGPIHNEAGLKDVIKSLKTCEEQGGKLLFPDQRLEKEWNIEEELKGGHWVLPRVVKWEGHALDYAVKKDWIVNREVFGPILHVLEFDTLEEAIEINNSVGQGLSSSLFTRDVGNLFKWVGPSGSDCGIVNLNQSTSGAEIGAGFGGNKATGWGRESGGDAWKQYARWSTCTINHEGTMQLAQGVKFD